MQSLCPLMYFVVEWTTTSIPSASGFWKYGVMKVLSQIDAPNGSIETSLLDLTHRSVAFSQDTPDLDWDRMRKIFLEARPGMVDARTLQSRRKMGAFFQGDCEMTPTSAAGAGRGTLVTLPGSRAAGDDSRS